MDHNLKDIFELFQTNADFREGRTYGNGHIHDTYFIETAPTDHDNYILQRLNNNVFKDIPKVQNNIERITQHLKEKINLLPGSDIKRECLTLIFSMDGKSWITDREGNYWRMYIFITDHKSYDVVDTPERAYEQALRFLSDYIDGDTYYKICHENHNLQRTRAQIMLLGSMESQFVAMQALIRKLI